MVIPISMRPEEWAKTGVVQDKQSIMTPLALVECELLETIEVRGPESLASLVGWTELSKTLVLMSVGALIRAGLVRATKLHHRIMLEGV